MIGAAIAIAVYAFSRTPTRRANRRARLFALAAMVSSSGQSGSEGDVEESVVPRQPDEYEVLLSFREQQFRDVLGFSDTASIILAEAGADWHEAEKLLLAGCPRDVVLNLLT